MKDFTLHTYRRLLETLLEQGYRFITFEQYCTYKGETVNNGENRLESDRLTPSPVNRITDKFILLRHDVERRAANSLATALIEHELGVRASYYFRVVPQSNQPDIIRAIAELGHEIGYQIGRAHV